MDGEQEGGKEQPAARSHSAGSLAEEEHDSDTTDRADTLGGISVTTEEIIRDASMHQYAISRVSDNKGERYAVKFASNQSDPKRREFIDSEINWLTILDHENILKCSYSGPIIIDNDASIFGLMTPYCEGPTWYDMIGKKQPAPQEQ